MLLLRVISGLECTNRRLKSREHKEGNCTGVEAQSGFGDARMKCHERKQ